MRRVLISALLAAVLLAPIAHGATAQPSFGLRAAGNPKAGYFIYTAHAGTTLHGVVIVSNSGTAAGSVTLSTADASTGATTGTIYLTDRAAKSSAKWIALGTTKSTLAVKRAVRVPFTVTVPAGTAPGQYVAGIVAAGANQPTGSSGGKTSVHIRIRNLAIMAVQVNVPGPVIHKFTVSTITAGGSRGYQQVLIRISNQGNVLEHPKGSISIYDSAGKLVETVPYTMDTFLPHTTIEYPVTLKKALPAGDYTTSFDISYGGGKTTTAKPALTVSKENVQQVFTSSAPTKAPPTTTTTTGTTSTSGGGGGSSSLPLIVIAAVAALVLLGGGVWVLRRRRGGARTRALRPLPPLGARLCLAGHRPGRRDPLPASLQGLRPAGGREGHQRSVRVRGRAPPPVVDISLDPVHHGQGWACGSLSARSSLRHARRPAGRSLRARRSHSPAFS
jgi:hypothetical protein